MGKGRARVWQPRRSNRSVGLGSCLTRGGTLVTFCSVAWQENPVEYRTTVEIGGGIRFSQNAASQHIAGIAQSAYPFDRCQGRFAGMHRFNFDQHDRTAPGYCLARPFDDLHFEAFYVNFDKTDVTQGDAVEAVNNRLHLQVVLADSNCARQSGPLSGRLSTAANRNPEHCLPVAITERIGVDGQPWMPQPE